MEQINEFTKRAMERGEELSKSIMEQSKSFKSGGFKTKDDALKSSEKMKDSAKDTVVKLFEVDWHSRTMKDTLKEHKAEKLQEGEVKEIEKDDDENIGEIASGERASKWTTKDPHGESKLKLEESELHQKLLEEDEQKPKKK